MEAVEIDGLSYRACHCRNGCSKEGLHGGRVWMLVGRAGQYLGILLLSPNSLRGLHARDREATVVAAAGGARRADVRQGFGGEARVTLAGACCMQQRERQQSSTRAIVAS